jgi:hypothetical protein
MWNEIWGIIEPILYAAFALAFGSVVTWACNAIRVSQWYKDRPRWQRRIVDFFVFQILMRVSKSTVINTAVDAALEKPVAGQMEEAATLKAKNNKVIPEKEAQRLRDKAVNTALNKIIMGDPKIDRVIEPKALLETIERRVPKVVDRQNKKRNRMRNRGH